MKTFPGALRVLLFTGLLGLAVGPAAAAHDEEEGDPRFTEMDTNGDGRLSRAESATGARSLFAALDADRDGFVTAAEMDAHQAQRRDAAIRFAASAPAEVSERAGGSGAARADGSVSSHEVANARGAPFPELSSAGKIRLSDRNDDGRLSAAEHEAGAAARFARLDADRDGLLSRVEYAAETGPAR